jgi:hypothetical protein
MRRRGARAVGIHVGGSAFAALALLLATVLAPAPVALAATTTPSVYCSEQLASAAGTALVTAAEARVSASRFILDVRTPGQFADWIAGHLDDGTRADDLDGHPAVYVFRVTNKYGAYLGYLTVDAVRRAAPVLEFSRSASPVFSSLSQAESSLAASGRDEAPLRQVYLGTRQYVLETAAGVSYARRYVRIAELRRPASADPIRGPPPKATGLSAAAFGTTFHMINGVPDYHQFQYDYRSTEYNASTRPAATGKYLTRPYLNEGVYYSGCAPTSAANVIKYWADQRGYTRLNPTSLPKYTPYNDPNDPNPDSPAKSLAQKLVNDLHIYFHTEYIEGGGGAAAMDDFGPGMLDYARQIGGYEFTATPLHWFSWVDYAAEIAADRPVVLGFNDLIVSAPDAFDYMDHAVTGVGYDYTPGSTGSQYMIIHDNWDMDPSDVYVQFDGSNATYTYRFMAAFAPAVAPTNDAFASATTVSGASGWIIGVSTSATKEPGEPNHAGSDGGASVWFRWIAPSTGWYAFSTVDSSFDTLLNVYTGTSPSTLTSITSCDDISGSVRQSRAGFYATAGTTYRIAIDGYSGAAGAYYLSWFPLCSVSGTVRTTGGAGVSGVNVTCSNGRAAVTNGSGGYTIAGLFDGDYTFKVAKQDTGFTPEVRTATVSGSNVSGVDFLGQNNDAFASAIPLRSASGTASGRNDSATRESGEPTYGGGASVWFSWTAPTSGRVWFSTVGSTFDTLLAVYTGSAPGGLTTVAYNDDYHYPGTTTSGLAFNAVAGATYRICIDGYKPTSGVTETGAYRLAWAPVAKAALTRPTLSTSSPKHGTYFTVTGYASPWFAGTVRVYLYRKVSGRYQVYPHSGHYVSRTVTTSGSRVKYTYKVRVPYAGSWAVRTYYGGGTFSTSNWSLYKYFTVR